MPPSRTADLIKQAKGLIGHALPKNAKEVGRSVTTFRRSKMVYDARAFISWKTARGTPGASSMAGKGIEPNAREKALENLVAKLEAHVRGELPPPPPPRAQLPKKPSPPKPPRRAPGSKKFDQALLATTRRLLAHLAPYGAKVTKRSIEVSTDSAVARVEWMREDKTAGSLELKVTKERDPVAAIWSKVDRAKRQK